MTRMRLGIAVFSVLALCSLIGLGSSAPDLDSPVLAISSSLTVAPAYAGDPDEYTNSPSADGDPDEYTGGTSPDEPPADPEPEEDPSGDDRYDTVALFVSGLSSLLNSLPL